MLEKTGFDSVVLGRLVFIDKDPLMRIKKLTEIIGDN